MGSFSVQVMPGRGVEEADVAAMAVVTDQVSRGEEEEDD